jgi:hypothetical protein
LTALAAVFGDAAEAVVMALDAGRTIGKSATLVGLRLLAAEWVMRARAHLTEFGPHDDAAIEEILADVDATLSIARGPRLARQQNLVRKTVEVETRQRDG